MAQPQPRRNTGVPPVTLTRPRRPCYRAAINLRASAGAELGYGLTNGFWDFVFNTDYPEAVKRVLYGTRWSLSPWRKKQKPLSDLDRQIVPPLIAVAGANAVTEEEAIHLLLASPKIAEIASGFGEKRKVISQTLARLKVYGLIAIRNSQLIIPHDGRIKAYVST